MTESRSEMVWRHAWRYWKRHRDLIGNVTGLKYSQENDYCNIYISIYTNTNKTS